MAELEVPPAVVLLESYGLTQDDWDLPIGELHLQKIAKDYCAGWVHLLPFLGMKNIIKNDILRGPGDEVEKRHNFFFKWQEKKGSSATYKKLVSALLEIEAKEDAEAVCEMLRGYVQSAPSSREVRKSPLLLFFHGILYK